MCLSATTLNALLPGAEAVGRSLEIGAVFLYKALWSILFGVLVTALIDVFVDKERMARLLGGRGLRTLGKATAAGAASSACTFGAVTIAHTLFKKGASAESTFAFSLASTNIVFELGILILVLLGAAFLGAEILAGFLLVAIMYALVRATLPVHVFEEARERMRRDEGDISMGFTPHLADRGDWLRQLRDAEAWRIIALRYFKTLGRIYKSVVVGFTIAGFVVALIPTTVWTTLFVRPDNVLGVAENAALGVVAGMLSFIGSIGIVPFAAALWVKGVSFAAAIGIIVSDLITVPVLNLWRKFYGTRAMLYVLGVFWLAMVVSAVIIEYLFRAFGWIPVRLREAQIVSLRLKVDYTLVMTVLFVLITAGLYAALRRPSPSSPEPAPAALLPEPERTRATR